MGWTAGLKQADDAFGLGREMGQTGQATEAGSMGQDGAGGGLSGSQRVTTEKLRERGGAET